ncbi:MAG TPA: hypothetical protein VMG10_12280 [Gemmataceae bacterium]|nr:hypothetical protein [Gemmataceae bacterium]
MSHDPKRTIAHALHFAAHTETGKKALHTAAAGTMAAASAVLGPAAAAVAVPAAVFLGIGWGLWKAFKS